MFNRRAAILLALMWAAFGLLLLCCPVRAAEPARLVVTLNCDDIRAIAQWKGWGELERRARAAGATEQQIEDALRCLATAR